MLNVNLSTLLFLEYLYLTLASQTWPLPCGSQPSGSWPRGLWPSSGSDVVASLTPL